MSRVGCVAIGDFKRPDKTLAEKFRSMAVANLDDCMNRTSVIHEDIRPVSKGKLLGPALTVKVPSGDNLMFHAAMDLAKPGDVTIIDAGRGTRHSILGELMVTYCRKCDIAGIVVNGSLRDAGVISQLTDFPIYTRGIISDGPYENGPDETNTPIVCGGRLVNLGLTVIGDEGGVIFINPLDTPELLGKVNKFHENEMRIINIIEKGSTHIHPRVNEKLEGPEVERINYVEY